MNKLNFTYNSGHAHSKMLVCPKCLETISQTDIESYSRCPFCDYHFERSSELEDFILRPVVEHWMEQYMPKQREQIYLNGKPV